MLSRRLIYDSAPSIEMSGLQSEMKAAVERKIRDGVYSFESVSCGLCGRDDFEEVSGKDRYGLYMPAVVCRGCGLLQTNPRMDAASYAMFYDTEYRRLYGDDPEDKDAFFRSQNEHGSSILRLLGLNGFVPPAGGRIVDIGCGAGGILGHFKQRGYNTVGLDLGSEYIEYGRQKHGLDLRVGTLSGLAEGESFDLIIYSHVFEHILDLKAELYEARRRLKDGGLLYIEAPSVGNLASSYEMDILKFMQNAHTYHFTLGTLRSLLSVCGFGMVLGGFELIRSSDALSAVFVKAEPIPAVRVKSDYPWIIEHLKRIEALRKILPFPPYYMKLALFRFFRRMGLYSVLSSGLNAFSKAKRV